MKVAVSARFEVVVLFNFLLKMTTTTTTTTMMMMMTTRMAAKTAMMTMMMMITVDLQSAQYPCTSPALGAVTLSQSHLSGKKEQWVTESEKKKEKFLWRPVVGGGGGQCTNLALVQEENE